MELKQNSSPIEDDKYYWAGILFLLGQEEISKTEILWEEYVNEIKYRSRFFPKSKLLDRIKESSIYASKLLKKGTVLYRARKFNSEHEYGKYEIEDLYKELRILFPERNLKLEDLYIESKFEQIKLWLLSDPLKFDKFEKKKAEVFGRKKSFWGFNEQESDAPPKNKVSGGRANSPNIRYLYASENIETALMEVQPKVDQAVNLAEIYIIKDIKIFDFNAVTEDPNGYLKQLSLETIAKKFSIPNYGDAADYYPTQFLCEYIRELGFKGIRFSSS